MCHKKTVSTRLRAMKRVYNPGKLVPHDLNERQMESDELIFETLLQRHERNSYLYSTTSGD